MGLLGLCWNNGKESKNDCHVGFRVLGAKGKVPKVIGWTI